VANERTREGVASFADEPQRKPVAVEAPLAAVPETLRCEALCTPAGGVEQRCRAAGMPLVLDIGFARVTVRLCAFHRKEFATLPLLIRAV
jgi:hypothetical protein